MFKRGKLLVIALTALVVAGAAVESTPADAQVRVRIVTHNRHHRRHKVWHRRFYRGHWVRSYTWR